MNEDEARQLLAVEANASRSELRAAYRAIVKLRHPDRFAADPASPPEAIRHTQRINQAYQPPEHNAGWRKRGECAERKGDNSYSGARGSGSLGLRRRARPRRGEPRCGNGLRRGNAGGASREPVRPRESEASPRAQIPGRERRLGSASVSGLRREVPGRRRLVIGNGGVLRMALMDSLGGVHTRFGGRGEGPGEFSSITSGAFRGRAVLWLDKDGMIS